MNRFLLSLVAFSLFGIGSSAQTVQADVYLRPATVVFASQPINREAISRESIRHMPLLMRPNRPFHFYGNTVRRLHARGFISGNRVR